MKKIVLGMMLAMVALSLGGCGTPSKSDVCGGCDAQVKEACELTYDACNDDGDCIDALEDVTSC